MRILTIYCLSAKYSFQHLALARFAFHISHLVSSLSFAHEEAKQLAFFFYAGSDPAYFAHCRRINPAIFVDCLRHLMPALPSSLSLLDILDLLARLSRPDIASRPSWKTLQTRKSVYTIMRLPCYSLAYLSHLASVFIPPASFSIFHFQFSISPEGECDSLATLFERSWDDCQNDLPKPLIINLTFPDFCQHPLKKATFFAIFLQKYLVMSKICCTFALA